MDNDRAPGCQLIEPLSPPERQPLLSSLKSSKVTLRERFAYVNCIPRRLCLPSKAAVLILLWFLIASAVYETFREGTLIAAFLVNETATCSFSHNYSILATYLVFVLLSLLYPFAGFLADVYYGRYKTVVTSLFFLLVAITCIGLLSFLVMTRVVHSDFVRKEDRVNSDIFIVLGGLGLLFLVIGLSGFRANITQLGLDQLMDAPNEYQGLFVHWMEWCCMLGHLPITSLFFAVSNCVCVHEYSKIQFALLSIGPVLFITLLLTVIFSCWKRRWFYNEQSRNNPYKMVIKVLNFARKHKYPLQRSAFTFAGEEEPSRIDFAKNRYGGPFTTEQVEDVKILFRILAILLVLSPVFLLQIPGEATVYEYASHTGHRVAGCSLQSVIEDVTVLVDMVMVITFPVYIWLVYSILRRCIPKTFIRIWIGEVLLLFGLAAMFIIDLSGHVIYHDRYNQSAECMFSHGRGNYTSLNLPWAVNIFPVFLTRMGIVLVVTTMIEFISAQSPHSMKGLLIGVFFAIRAIFNFVGVASLFPFSLTSIWTVDDKIINCGFGYYLCNCLIGVGGLVLFSIAAKQYRYRERNDPPFNQMLVERVWANS